MWKDESSIQSKFLNKIILIGLISSGLWFFVWIQAEYSAFRSESKSLRTKYINSQKVILKNEVASLVNNIQTMRRVAVRKLESATKERVYEAHQIAMNLYEQNVDSKDLFEIKKMIKDALRPIRFNGQRGYYFAVSMDGIEQLYPVRPELEGKNLMGLQDSKGNFVIQDEIEVIDTKGEGFVKHFWTKPGREPTTVYPKISFVKYFKPLNWYLGTGEYLDEAKQQIQKEILNRIVNLRFGAEGYFFGSTYQGDCLFSNGKVTIGSGNIWNLTDPNGVKIIQEQKKAIKNPDGDFVYYSWNKLTTSIPSPKISFVQGIPEWGWTIGAGAYTDTIEQTIFENKAALIKELKNIIFRSVLLLSLLLCLVYFWFNRISQQIQNSVGGFLSFLEKAGTDSVTIDPDIIQLKEFQDIAVSTNKVLSARILAESALKESEQRYRLLVEETPALICRFLPGGEVTFVNKSYCDYFGKSFDELIGSNFLNRIPESDRQMVMDSILSLTAKSPTLSHTHRVFTPNGDICWQRWTNQALFDAGGKIIACQSVGEDITRRIKTEQALKSSEEKFATAFHQGPMLMTISSIEDGKYLEVNETFTSITGYSKKECIGTTSVDLGFISQKNRDS